MLEWAGWPLLWCVLGIVVTGYPTLLSEFADVQGGLGDPLLVNFTLEHSFRWMTGMPLAADLWSPPIFYPTRGVANYTDLLLGVAPLYWPWRWFDLGPHTAYQLWMFACWTANFIVFFLLLKRGFKVSVFAASAGAALFAFGSPRTANIMHQQLVSQFYLALVLLAAIELIRSSNRGCWSAKSWLWTATFFSGLVLQFVTAVYPLVFAFLASLAALLAACLSPSCRGVLIRVIRRNALPILVCAAVAALVTTPVLLRYLGTVELVGFRKYSVHKLPQLVSWFAMGKSNLMYGWLQELSWFRRAGMPLHHNGVGLLTTVLSAIGLWQNRRNRSVQFLLVGLAALFLFTLRLPGDMSLWKAVREVIPGAAALRAVARVATMGMFPAAVGLGFFMNRFTGRKFCIAAALSLLVMAEQIHTPVVFNKQAFEERVAEIAARVPDDAEAFFLVSTTGKTVGNPHDTAAWVALASGVPTINGRYGNRPRGWQLRDVNVSSQEATDRIGLSLRRWESKRNLDSALVAWVSAEPGDISLDPAGR